MVDVGLVVGQVVAGVEVVLLAVGGGGAAGVAERGGGEQSLNQDNWI